MNKKAFTPLLLLAALTAQAQTFEPAHAYGSFAPGVSHLNLDCTGATSCGSSATGFNAKGGYAFGNGFAVEAGYIKFGRFSASGTGLYLAAKPSAMTFGAAYSLSLTRDWALNARLGVAHVRTQLTAISGNRSGSNSQAKAKIYAGAGVSYAMSKTVQIELSLTTTEAQFESEKGTLRLVGLGTTFAF